jgi:4-amino-4-deoxy-L-arabinose transferase-like glycosyltransferase
MIVNNEPRSLHPTPEPEVRLTRIERAIAPWCQSPARLLTYLVGLHALLWIIVPSLVHRAPPIDVVEGYMWGREWVLATYKHPAMPSWFIEASRIVTAGAIGWPVYIVSQIFVALTVALVFCLGRDLMDAPRAAAGAISILVVEYISWMSPQLNHNIVQLPFWVGAVWCAWRAVDAADKPLVIRSNQPKPSNAYLWWIALGTFAGLGLYAKLTHGLILAIITAWFLFDERARRTLATPGPWVAVAVCVLIAAPLLTWLIQNDFRPLTYASDRGADPAKGSFAVFFPSIFLIALPILLLASATGTFGAPWDLPRRADGGPHTDPRARRFLWLMTLAPLLVLIVFALVKGAGLRASWTAPMLMLIGTTAIMVRSTHWDHRALMRQTAYAVPVLVLVPLIYAVSMSLPINDRGKPIRIAWPAKAIAERFDRIWAKETGAPLRLVAGEAWISGLVGIPHRDNPSIFTDADPDIAPWVSHDRAKRDGVLVLWEERIAHKLPPTMLAIIAGRPKKTEQFPVRGGRGDRMVEISYVIVPPAAK